MYKNGLYFNLDGVRKDITPQKKVTKKIHAESALTMSDFFSTLCKMCKVPFLHHPRHGFLGV